MTLFKNKNRFYFLHSRDYHGRQFDVILTNSQTPTVDYFQQAIMQVVKKKEEEFQNNKLLDSMSLIVITDKNNIRDYYRDEDLKRN